MFALIFLIVFGENCIHLIFVEKKPYLKSPPANNLRRQLLSEIVKQMFVYPKINYGAVMSRGKIFSSLVPGLISQRIKSLSWIQLWYSDTNIDYTLDNPRHGRISSLCNAQQGNSLSKETWLTSSQTKLNHSSIQERPWGFSYRPKNVVKSRLSFDNSLCPVFKLAGYQRTAKDNASTMQGHSCHTCDCSYAKCSPRCEHAL